MAIVQSSIRDKVSKGEFPAPKGADAFSAYVIASGKGLIPEMENAARQTLDHPMTFEILGEGLRLSEGWALRDLAKFRKRYRDNLVSCFTSFLKVGESQSNIWTSCASYSTYQSKNRRKNSALYGDAATLYSRSYLPMSNMNKSLPSWLAELYQKHLTELQETFSKSLFNPRSIRGEYLSALQAHIDSESHSEEESSSTLQDHIISESHTGSCVSCTKVHTEKGEMFCRDLEDRLTQALNEVCYCQFFKGIVGV